MAISKSELPHVRRKDYDIILNVDHIGKVKVRKDNHFLLYFVSTWLILKVSKRP